MSRKEISLQYSSNLDFLMHVFESMPFTSHLENSSNNLSQDSIEYSVKPPFSSYSLLKNSENYLELVNGNSKKYIHITSELFSKNKNFFLGYLKGRLENYFDNDYSIKNGHIVLSKNSCVKDSGYDFLVDENDFLETSLSFNEKRIALNYPDKISSENFGQIEKWFKNLENYVSQ